MRNLRNSHRRVLRSPEGLCLTASAWDVATDSLICAFGPTEDDVLIHLKRWKLKDDSSKPSPDSLSHIASWDAPCPLPNLDCDKILSLHYFSESFLSCLILAGGDIMVVREQPQYGEEKIEIVGSVDAGISAAVWSPDGELLAISTCADTLLYMTRDFENVVDINLSPDDLKASKHVSVGWGKSETQFKGKRARLLRDPTMPEKVDQGNLSQYDRKETSLSWRGDGAYIAVNSILAESRRVVRVYSREGTLDSVSEPVDGLEGALSWRPLGNLLSGVQRHDDSIDIVFFERNGLRHGQFDLRLTKEELHNFGVNIELRWNADSTILAVCLEDRVQLWTMGNYHYYLKAEVSLLLGSANRKTVSVVWHPELALRLAIVDKSGLQRLEYSFHVSSGPTSPPFDYGIIGVVDGKRLKLTSLRLANVPPPMALHEIVLTSNIIDFAVANVISDSRNTRLAILDQESLTIYQWDVKAKPFKPPVVLALKSVVRFHSVLAEESYKDNMLQQIAWSDPEHIIVLSSHRHSSILFSFRVSSSSVSLVCSTEAPFMQAILTMQEKGGPKAFCFASEGSVYEESKKAHKNQSQVISGRLIKFPADVTNVKLVDASLALVEGSVQRGSAGTIAFGLSRGGSLFANERLVAKDCTSFLVTATHLIFTTTKHLLKFVHMAPLGDLEVPPDTPESDERCRSIERGAVLITVMPNIFALVLQMPRGNLETVYPRALVLAGIRQNLNRRKYRAAFLTCRNHRVDMNILYDHSPYEFLSSVSSFVEQVCKVEHVDLFLSQLREEDVSKTMYKETSNLQKSGSAFDADAVEQATELSLAVTLSKVNKICDAFLNVLRTSSANIQNTITAHVCKIPPDLESALLEVAKVQSMNNVLIIIALKFDEQPIQVDRVVEHICFLADANKLYDNALGLYNLELALLVAQQSQKDPREYLPFLQSLQEMPSSQRQYAINNSLKRYNKALMNLYDLKVFDEFKDYAIKHTLYKDALQCCRYNEEETNSIIRVYAEYLQRESKHKEAGIAFEYLDDRDSATEAYCQARMWRESLSCATSIPLPKSQIISLAKTLADYLVESKDFQSAAIIHLDYLHDIDTAVRLFCKGYSFVDASRVLGLHQRMDLIEIVDMGLMEGMGSMTETLAECKGQLNAQVPRLRELRIKKMEEPIAFFGSDGTDIPDNVSLAPTDASTTGGSLFTRYTDRTGTIGTNVTRQTSRNRRREERKRARGKKGSVYEEEYLVHSIGRLIGKVNGIGDDVGRLVVGLTRRGMRERAKAVEGAMMEMVCLCRASISEVFQNETRDENNLVKEEEDTGRPKGGDGVLWDSIEETQSRKEAPPIKDFPRLSLLGS